MRFDETDWGFAMRLVGLPMTGYAEPPRFRYRIPDAAAFEVMVGLEPRPDRTHDMLEVARVVEHARTLRLGDTFSWGPSESHRGWTFERTPSDTFRDHPSRCVVVLGSKGIGSGQVFQAEMHDVVHAYPALWVAWTTGDNDEGHDYLGEFLLMHDSELEVGEWYVHATWTQTARMV